MNQDIEFLKQGYAAARRKYRPVQVTTLIIAEAPPCALDRFFYFEEVNKQDSLFLEIMGVLYPDKKERYIKSGRDPLLKEELLEYFKSDGFWLMDLSEIPTSLINDPLENYVPGLMKRIDSIAGKDVPIILIKSNVYDLCYEPLSAAGYNVINERMPFPGSGQQGNFREKFRRALELRS